MKKKESATPPHNSFGSDRAYQTPTTASSSGGLFFILPTSLNHGNTCLFTIWFGGGKKDINMKSNLPVSIPYYYDESRRDPLGRDKSSELNSIIDQVLAGIGEGYNDFVDEVVVSFTVSGTRLNFKVRFLGLEDTIKIDLVQDQSGRLMLIEATDRLFHLLKRFLSESKTKAEGEIFRLSQLHSAPLARQGR